MIITITAKTGKGSKSTKKEVDKTVDTVLAIGEMINKKFKNIREGICRRYGDGASLVLNTNKITKKGGDRKA